MVQDDSVWGKLAKASNVDIDFDLLDNFFGIESLAVSGAAEVVKVGILLILLNLDF